jgi:hypothetical protein
MRKLIESTHVALGGQIDPLDWAFPFLDDEHGHCATTGMPSLIFFHNLTTMLHPSATAI